MLSKRPIWGSWKPLNSHGDRWQRVWISASGSLLSRGVGLACNLMTIPIAVSFLGGDSYGVWLTLTSFSAVLAFLDLGIGVGLQNQTTELLATNRLKLAGNYLRSTLALLLVIVTGIFTLGVATIYFTPIISTISSSTQLSEQELRLASVIVLGALLLGLPLSLFARIAIGAQQGWIAGIITAIGAVLTLGAVSVGRALHVSFSQFVGLTLGAPIVAQAVGYFFLKRAIGGNFGIVGPIAWGEGLVTLRAGLPYVLPQITNVILTQAPIVVLGTLSSPMDAAIYGVLIRIGNPLQQIQQVVLAQIWPAINEAFHKKEFDWLYRNIRKLLKVNLAFCLLTAATVAIGAPWAFKVLVRGHVQQPSLTLFILYALQLGVTGVVFGLAYLANGLLRVKAQNHLALVSSGVALAILPPSATHYGIWGVMSILLLLNALVAVPILFWEFRSYMNQFRRSIETGSSI